MNFKNIMSFFTKKKPEAKLVSKKVTQDVGRVRLLIEFTDGTTCEMMIKGHLKPSGAFEHAGKVYYKSFWTHTADQKLKDFMDGLLPSMYRSDKVDGFILSSENKYYNLDVYTVASIKIMEKGSLKEAVKTHNLV